MPKTYRRISGADLEKGLAAAHVSAAQFAALYNVSQKRVEKWLSGEAEIPHNVALFVGLIADPTILEKALIITRYMMVEDEAVEGAERSGTTDGRAMARART